MAICSTELHLHLGMHRPRLLAVMDPYRVREMDLHRMGRCPPPRDSLTIAQCASRSWWPSGDAILIKRRQPSLQQQR
jgi:hypothetical protein